MPLRPIDAIFVHPKRRLYVVYYRGILWQLPRMKIDNSAWQRRHLYNDNINALYLSRRQAIHDPVLAQKLRTLNLPAAVRGSTLPLFEAWWEAHGFDWLEDKLISGQSPLAAHKLITRPSALNTIIDSSSATQANDSKNNALANAAVNITPAKQSSSSTMATATNDIFVDMLADLVDEVMHHRL
ncbi:hypothetical protein [Psychrobacter frigidicola]|uniref:hypothetical protein n=1 Tax=Psychrobacter frigidicola TaxID=45611 RepID=UPI001917F399|nr:hypothetical protein [Psychrobacter frigidicola]